MIVESWLPLDYWLCAVILSHLTLSYTVLERVPPAIEQRSFILYLV